MNMAGVTNKFPLNDVFNCVTCPKNGKYALRTLIVIHKHKGNELSAIYGCHNLMLINTEKKHK